MKTKDKKGMTLIEVMIAIALMTTVLSIGYTIFNKVNTSPKEQSMISDVQNGMNNIRSLISKEVKYCEGIEIQYINKNSTVIESIDKYDNLQMNLEGIKKDITSKILSEDELSYQYNILKDISENTREIESIYEVNITTINNKKYFSINKIDSRGISLNLISRQSIVENILPMDINKENRLYNISINYINNNEKQYSFDVYSEFTSISQSCNDTSSPDSGNDVIDEIKPPNLNLFTNYNMLGFWVADNSKLDNKNLYTWISDNKKLLGEQYSTYTGHSESFNISGSARPGNNKQTNTSMSDSIKTATSYVKNIKIGDKNISQISIYVSPNTTLENISIKGQQGNSSIVLPDGIDNIDGGYNGKWVDCIITKNGNSKVNFSFSGKILFNRSKVSSGYVIILYK